MTKLEYGLYLGIAILCLFMVALPVGCTYHQNQLIATAADPIEMKCALDGGTRSGDSACVIAALSRK